MRVILLSLVTVVHALVTLPVTAAQAQGAGYSLLVSSSPDRSNPAALDNTSVAGKIYVFTSPNAGVQRVRFFLDDTGMTKRPRQTDNNAPYDFAGGSVAVANAFDTTKIPDGAHVITAAVDLQAGGTEVVSATFTVANTAPALVWSPPSVTLSVPADGSTTDQVTLSASSGTATFTLASNASWLTLDSSAGSTPANVTLTVDATTLAAGTYSAQVTATADGYSAGTLAVTLQVGSGSGDPGPGPDLFVSTSPDRASPVPLHGASLTGNAYVFTAPDAGVKQVRFFLDDPGMTKTPRQVEKTAPFDFAGGSVALANAFDTTKIADGTHVITTAVDLVSNETVVLHGSFTVANNEPALTWSPDPVTLSVPEGGGTTTLVNLNATTGTANVTVSGGAPWLAVSPTSGSTPASITVAVDASGLQAGTYMTVVTASAAGYLSDDLTVVLTVAAPTPPAPPDQVHLAWTGDPATTLVVVWRTSDTATPSVVEYRRLGEAVWQTATGAVRPSGTAGRLHEVTLSQLTPSTTYEYRVPGDHGAWSPTFAARTAPPPGPADFDAVYVADTGIIGRLDGLATGTQQVIEHIAALNPLVVLLGGDYAYFDTDKRFGSLNNTIDAWFNQMQPIGARSPMMPAYGNHEVLLGENYAAWAARFPTPAGFDGRRYYSFDIGDVHFVSIFAVEGSTGLPSSALEWIEADITAALKAGQRWIVPFFHVSPFSDGANHPSNLALRAQLGPLFERLGVKIAISSHDQSFERTYPLVDVPVTNTPTSAARRCYTMADGVTWVKVSPGGKLSNKNGSFSHFRTQPPPAYTAVRDNTAHHFARLSVQAEGAIGVETYAVAGDGTPPILQDHFVYTTGTCPPEFVFSARRIALAAPVGGSATADVDLDIAGGGLQSFTVTPGDAWLSTHPTAGSTPARLSVTAHAAGLAAGVYWSTLTADGPGVVTDSIEVALTVGDQYGLLVSSRPDRADPQPLDGAVVSGNIYVFTAPDAGVKRVRFFLDDPEMTKSPRQTENTAPFDFVGGSVSLANPFDSSKLSSGAHTITAAIDLTSGAVHVVTATFLVP